MRGVLSTVFVGRLFREVVNARYLIVFVIEFHCDLPAAARLREQFRRQLLHVRLNRRIFYRVTIGHRFSYSASDGMRSSASAFARSLHVSTSTVSGVSNSSTSPASRARRCSSSSVRATKTLPSS